MRYNWLPKEEMGSLREPLIVVLQANMDVGIGILVCIMGIEIESEKKQSLILVKCNLNISSLNYKLPFQQLVSRKFYTSTSINNPA